jgi:hypothetical protein
MIMQWEKLLFVVHILILTEDSRHFRLILNIIALRLKVSFYISDYTQGEEQTLGYMIIRHCFIVDYCSTCHSTEGASIDGEIIMVDYEINLLVGDG